MAKHDIYEFTEDKYFIEKTATGIVRMQFLKGDKIERIGDTSSFISKKSFGNNNEKKMFSEKALRTLSLFKPSI